MSLSLNITSEENVTINKLVGIAGKIWKDVRRRKINIAHVDRTRELLKEMQEKYPKFSQAYPIVLRYMCQMGEYDAKAFRYWLMHIETNPWKTEEAYLEAQADYIVKLYRCTHPRANTTEVNNLRANIRRILTQEHDAFKKSAKESEEAVTKNEAYLRGRNNDELYAFVRNVGQDGIDKAESIRVISDLSCKNEFVGPNLDTIPHEKNTSLMSADDLLG